MPQTPTPAVQSSPGSLSGAVIDDTGAAIAGATVALFADEGRPRVEALSGEDGRFSMPGVPAGPFRLTVSAPGFADQTVSGALVSGDVVNVPPIRLTVAAEAISVDVTPTRVELAEQQIKAQEQQRVLGALPNFYVSYDPNAVPLTAKQKLKLSWKSRVDPARFIGVGILAGVQQARNDFSGFGDGASGYAKRYAAAYATTFTGGLIRLVLMPALFHQDPRYFYKGTGSTASRVGYALSTAVVRKGDNGRWQPNVSGILGSFAAAALSNLYYPAEDRRGFRLTLDYTLIGIGGSAVGHLMQEFLLKRLTSHVDPARGGRAEPAPR